MYFYFYFYFLKYVRNYLVIKFIETTLKLINIENTLY